MERLDKVFAQRFIIAAGVFKLMISQRECVDLSSIEERGDRVEPSELIVAGHIAHVENQGIGVFCFELAELADKPSGSTAAVLKWIKLAVKVVKGEKGDLLQFGVHERSLPFLNPKVPSSILYSGN